MYLGIDLGTSGVKSLIIDDDHQVVALAEASLEVQRPADGWSEQLADDWIDATSKTFAELQSKFPDIIRSVRGIGLSGQQHGATVIDAADKPLRPCILWNATSATACGQYYFRRFHSTKITVGGRARAGHPRQGRQGITA